MKKIWTVLALLLLFAPTVQAHSVLIESNPAEGATMQEELSQISLTFNTKVEEGSTFTLVSGDGQELTPLEVNIQDSVLTGTFDPPVPNADYTVEYDVIGADGHPIEGSYTFSVAVETNEQEAEEPEDETIEDDTKTEDTSEQSSETDPEEASTTDNSEENSTNWVAIVVIAVVVIALIVILGVSRRKSKGR
ncbi:copper resistance CopC family protein [Radiobacillus deserti]|uniref:Copper resistance protein CopC n=1 Tax=Radiobacillus deserti TaxID=2594883 RepID=A0A516KDZ0_9BACI|nr:copper resistance CopC family protein [Radiobacillus deserti]QDP39600.1 copper resistance protein CopC [Radiobacillus deserti]